MKLFIALNGLVLRHKSDSGYFLNDADALSKNKDNPAADLYSILDELESMRNLTDGRLHFRLCYLGTINHKIFIHVFFSSESLS